MEVATADTPVTSDPTIRELAFREPAHKGPLQAPGSKGTTGRTPGFRGLAILEAAISGATREVSTKPVRQGSKAT